MTLDVPSITSFIIKLSDALQNIIIFLSVFIFSFLSVLNINSPPLNLSFSVWKWKAMNFGFWGSFNSLIEFESLDLFIFVL